MTDWVDVLGIVCAVVSFSFLFFICLWGMRHL